MTDDLINPGLYRRLQQYYGQDDVEVVNPGYEINWRVEYDPRNNDGQGSRKVLDSGEEYRVRCKNCRDDRPRLYINAHWGVLDAETQSKNLWLVNCFNENCYAEFQDQQRLYNSIWSLNRRHGQPSHELRRGRPSEPRELCEIKNPGALIRLDELARDYPCHEAVDYLASRGIDAASVGRLWGASYCISSTLRLASHRIIIPIRQLGMQVGWQARYIGDNVQGMPFNVAGIPKYWTSPGMPRRLVAYNIERAMLHPTVVIVEGTTDVWNVGPMGIGLLGVTMSGKLQGMLREGMKRHGDAAVVVVMLDPQLPRRNNPKQKSHPIDVLTRQLAMLMPGRVMSVRLPQDFDPGSIDRRLMRQMIHKRASDVGLAVTFARPSRHQTAC